MAAKKKVTKKVTKKAATIDGGSVSVTLGVTVSANYQSQKYEVGLSRPIPSGSTPEKALAWVGKEVEAFFDETVAPVIDKLADHVKAVGDRRKSRSS